MDVPEHLSTQELRARADAPGAGAAEVEAYAKRLQLEHGNACMGPVSDARIADELLAELRRLAGSERATPRVQAELAEALASEVVESNDEEDLRGRDIPRCEDLIGELADLARAPGVLPETRDSLACAIGTLHSTHRFDDEHDRADRWLAELARLARDPGGTSEQVEEYATSLKWAVCCTERPRRAELLKELRRIYSRSPGVPALELALAQALIEHASLCMSEDDGATIGVVLAEVLQVLERARWPEETLGEAADVLQRGHWFGGRWTSGTAKLLLDCHRALLRAAPGNRDLRGHLAEALADHAYRAQEDGQVGLRRACLRELETLGGEEDSLSGERRALANALFNLHYQASDAGDWEEWARCEERLRALGGHSRSPEGVRDELAGLLVNAHWDYRHRRGMRRAAARRLDELRLLATRPRSTRAQEDQLLKGLRNAHHFAVERDEESAPALLAEIRDLYRQGRGTREEGGAEAALALARAFRAACTRDEDDFARTLLEELRARCEEPGACDDEWEILRELENP